jgi:membrane-associated phospholipid phosphatase
MDRETNATARPPRPDRREQARSSARRVDDVLYTTLRFIARHVHGFWTAIIAFLGLGLAAGAAATASFALVATAMEVGFTERVDSHVLHWFAERRTPLMDRLMLEVTTLGNGLVLFILVGTVSAFLWLTHHRWSVYLLIVGVVGGQLLNNALKEIFARPRPDTVPGLAHVVTPSFPSGHAMTAIIAYGAVAYLVGRLEPTRAMRLTTWSLAAFIVLAIGLSRVYLGVHYPSDVIAGFVAGLAWLFFVAASVKAIRFFSPRRPETVAEEPSMNPAAPHAP